MLAWGGDNSPKKAARHQYKSEGEIILDELESCNEASQSTQDLVLIINRAGFIENLFNQIITGYCSPREHAWYFMWSVVLDTSVMPLGAKLKVVMAIAQELNFKLPRNALTKVIQLRNSFAHTTTNANPVIVVDRKNEESEQYNEFHTLDSNGVLKITKRHEALAVFNESYSTSKAALIVLLDLVKAQLEQHKKYSSDSI